MILNIYVQEPRALPAGSSITHLFEYENWKTLEKYIETDVANYLQKLFAMLMELRAERLGQVGTPQRIPFVDAFVTCSDSVRPIELYFVSADTDICRY